MPVGCEMVVGALQYTVVWHKHYGCVVGCLLNEEHAQICTGVGRLAGSNVVLSIVLGASI